LEIAYSQVALSPTELRKRFLERCASVPGQSSGVWRYAEFLPEVEPSALVTFPEGNTPLLGSQVVSDWVALAGLRLKHEGLNPTGSFKDRGMTVAITQARRMGATSVACASTGNTSASLAAYAALAGLPAVVLIPAGQVALGKLTQTTAFGARTLAVAGDFDTCLTLLQEAARQTGLYVVNSVNPYRIEGQKTMVFELLQQLDWEPPDWIALPAGNLGNTAALGKALDELVRAGLIGRTPRILAVQASGAAPFARAFADDFRVRHTVRAETVATAIRIGRPASWNRAVRAIRSSRGAVVAVEDAEILEAKAVVDSAGIGCEPASAAAVAGLRRAVRQGLVQQSERAVAVLTGHILKDPETVAWYHNEYPAAPRRNRIVEVRPALADVLRAIEHQARPT
jgi:threonine synthase